MEESRNLQSVLTITEVPLPDCKDGGILLDAYAEKTEPARIQLQGQLLMENEEWKRLNFFNPSLCLTWYKPMDDPQHFHQIPKAQNIASSSILK